MKHIIIINCLLFCLSCKSYTQNNNKPQNVTIEDTLIFEYKNDTIKQIVKIIIVSDKEISFNIKSENQYRNTVSYIEGLAKNDNIDIEIDEDEEGIAYPVHEFIYSHNNCWLSFRINFEKTRLNINEADCKIGNPYCPFYSVGVLKRR